MELRELATYCLGTLPEIILGLTVCVVILLDMFTPLRRSREVCGSTALLGIVWAFMALLFNSGAMVEGAGAPFPAMLAADNLGRIFKLIFMLGAAATVLFSMRSRETGAYRQGEYYGLILGATLAACLLADSRHFVMFVLALETLSLCSYVLAGFVKHQRLSAEASLKYLLYGAVASSVMLFGISYLYGLTGTLEIGEAMRAFTQLGARASARSAGAVPADFGQVSMALVLALVLVLVGLGFKIAMVPFQFWAPDVYQGSPTPVTAFLAVVSKAAGFSALLRVFKPLFIDQFGPWLAQSAHLPVLFGVLSVLTMCFGNLVALRQTDIKRLLAYSSIAHAGYILMAMTVYTPDAVRMMLAYFVIYLFMTLGIFWCAIILIDRLGGADLARFRGARLKAPFLFWVTFVFLISLTGVPPTAGFVGKLLIFQVVVGAGLVNMANGAFTPAAWAYFALALIGAVNSVVAAFYYLKVAKAMAFDAPADDNPIPMDLLDRALAVVFMVPVILLLYFTPVLNLVKDVVN